ncbi:MAG TPA: AAA family ATPase [Candidatus Binatia bacterium]|nr:AAA family ATPase [Candidatus Binatia bacterium]
MTPRQTVSFPPFRLDPANEQVWRDDRPVPLRPKTFAVLAHLVARAGVLVTKAELLQAIWPATHGADGLPKKSVYELRRALGDCAGTPRFIQTVPRRGWRFIAPLLPVPVSRPGPAHLAPDRPPRDVLVGRERELAELHDRLGRTLAGQRQVVFVTGEPGIGKTALVQAFWDQVAPAGQVCLARGQCVEHHGGVEGYLPVLEALQRLCQAADGEALLALLRRHAPTWLLQMPALLAEGELEALQRKVVGASKERMLREMAEALQALTARHPLALWLEDLQWSDYSTLDLLQCLARREEPARLLLIATCRPADVIARGHPLRAVKEDLQAHGRCTELALGSLDAADVARYLAVRFGAATETSPELRELAGLIHQNSDGNPLYMVSLVDFLVDRGWIGEEEGRWHLRGRPEEVAAGVPDTLRRLIECQLDALPAEEQGVLEAASVAGAEFSAAAVAAALGEPWDRVEHCCEGLARRGHFLVARGAEPLPDGTLAGRYGFGHALHRKVLYERVGIARRVLLHRRIGEGLERLPGLRGEEMAAELAMHFERGRDPLRAVRHLARAARTAVQRSAHREAIDLLERALDLVPALPDVRQRAEEELALRVALAVPLMVTRGYTAPEVRAVYERARELCRQLGETPNLFPVVVGLSRFYYGWSSMERKNASAEELLRLAERREDPSLLLVAHMMQGGNLFFRGDFAGAQAHAEQGLALWDPQQHRPLVFLYGDDPQVLCHCWAALALWYRGYPDQALARVRQGLRIAEDLAYPFGVAFARFWTAFLHQARGEVREAGEQAETLVAAAETQGIPQFAAMGSILRGWALAAAGAEGLAEILRGMERLRAVGQALGRPYFSALLAEAYRRRGQIEAALGVVGEALALTDKTGEHMHQADLYRLQGELLAPARGGPRNEVGTGAPPRGRPAGADEAEASFETALEIARRQGARSLELRAALGLGRLWRRQGRAAQARRLLAETYGWFAEGQGTRDLREARALLEELGGRSR